MNRIRTVVFDIGGVLAEYRSWHIYEDRGYDPEMAARLGRATTDSVFWPEMDRGLWSQEEIIRAMCHLDPALTEDIDRVMQDFTGIVTRKRTALPWLRRLKAKGLQVLCLSNFSWPVQRDCSAAFDFLPELDGGILSYQDHVIKPNPEIYELLIHRYDLDPQSCVFLDDTYRNLPMAAHFGMRTIQYVDQQQAEQDLENCLAAEPEPGEHA